MEIDPRNETSTFEAYLLQQANTLRERIFTISNPDRALSISQLELIQNLSSAAVQLMASVELLDRADFEEPQITEIAPPELQLEVVNPISEKAVESAPLNPEGSEIATQQLDSVDIVPGTSKSTSFTDRELSMITLMRKDSTPGEWFRRREIAMDSIAFASTAAYNAAFSGLTQKLVEIGVVEATGIKGGRRYRFIDEAVEIEPRDTEMIVGESVTEITQQPEKQLPLPPRPDLMMSATQRLKLGEDIRFTASLVDGIRRHLGTAPESEQRRAAVVTMLTKKLRVEVPEANRLLGAVIAKNHYHLARGDDGSRYVRLGPADQ